MIKIRLANPKDATNIAHLGSTTFTEAFGQLFRDKNDLTAYCKRTFSVEKIYNGLKKANNIFFIAFFDKKAVGYAKLKLYSPSDFITSEKVCQLQKIYVLNNYLSLKIGFQLQNLLLKTAKENGFEKIWLSVYKNNIKAIRFYEKNDFKSIGNHDFNIGKEHFEFIVMVKNVY